jgi:hypothetical protein
MFVRRGRGDWTRLQRVYRDESVTAVRSTRSRPEAEEEGEESGRKRGNVKHETRLVST